MAREGIDFRLERRQGALLHDTRKLSERLRDALADDVTPTFVMAALAAAVVFVHAAAELLFVLAIAFYFFARSAQKSAGLPLRMPKSSGVIDPKQISLKDGKPERAQGIFFMGNDMDTGEEVWMTDVQARTHMLFMGTTGSGKTEYLISVVYNALIHGSGLIYVDGKADSSLYGKVYSMARAMGREDDVLVINFQTGAKDIYGAQPSKLSNTLNSFAVGSSGMLSELVKGLMASGDKSTWTQQAESFVEALMKPLVFLRDKHGLLLDVNTVREYFDLNKLEDLAWRDGEKYAGLEEAGVLDGLRNYLLTKPAYKKEKYHDQSETTHEQHGYITMQLIRTFNSLSDTYGYIMKTPLAEIDFVDVFLNRRILVVLLPALEKSPPELTNLGRIVVASIKATMAKGLGSTLEGDWSRVIDSKPTTAPSAFTCVLDEYGYYAVEGFAVVPAQARSLGFSAIFAGQDLPAFEKASKEEAASTLANTNTRLCGKLECTKTYEFFNNIAGKGIFTKTQSYEHDNEAISPGSFRANDGISIDRIERVSFESLRGQDSGQWHLFFANTIVRVKSFYANPKPVKSLRVNHFIKVGRPDAEEIEAYKSTHELFARAVGSDGGLMSYMDRVSTPSDIADIHSGLVMFQNDEPLVRAGKALAYSTQAEAYRAARFSAEVTASSFDGLGDDVDVMGHMQGAASPEAGDDGTLPFIGVEEGGEGGAPGPVAPWQSTPYGGAPQVQQPQADSHSEFADIGEPLPQAVDTIFSTAGTNAGYGFPVAPSEPEAAAHGETFGAHAAAPEISPDDPIHGIPDDVIAESDEFILEAQQNSTHADYGDGFNDDLVSPVRRSMISSDEPSEHEQTTVFGLEAAPPEIIAESNDEPSSMAHVHEQVTEPAQFDAPLAEEGLLSREATVSGLAAVERATGAPETESLLTASAVAEAVGTATTYPITPPTQKADFARFESLARRVSHLLGKAAEDDD